MNSVIMIAYNFPPDGSAGVHRPLRFVQHLTTVMKWNTTVISLDAENFERYDPGLLTLVPKETEVVRVAARGLWKAIQARREKYFRRKLITVPIQVAARIHAAHNSPFRSRIREIVHTAEAWCYHPDMAMGWIRPAVKATVNLCARKASDVIWATGGPWSAFVVAQRASYLTGVPYVLDFRDAWTLAKNDFELRRPAWATRLDRRSLYRLLQGAQAVIFRYHSEAECYWRAYQTALKAAKIHIIPNGYSGVTEDFVSADGERCMILYAGTMPPYRYDTLLQALRQMKNSAPGRASHLHFLFVGEGNEDLADEVALAGLSDMVTTMGPVSQAEVVRLQRNAHVLLLLGVKPMKGYELCGSKVFGYLKANRSILGIVSPADEMRKVLNRVGISTVADPDSPCEIVAVLNRLLDAWSTETLSSLLPNQAACEVYSAERQTAALIRALEGVEAAEPFIPGSVEIPPSLREEISHGNWLNNGGPN